MPAKLPDNARGVLRRAGTELIWGARTYIMGVVNVTPDSFSGDGRPEVASANAYAVGQAARGADILDIGAESTRPGYVPVDAQTELTRLLPVVREVRRRLPHALISVDTHKPLVFQKAREAGADILNCIWGLPDELLGAAAEDKTPVVIMHNKARPEYDDVMDEVLRFLDAAAKRAVNAGIPPEAVILDPGIGFGKTPEHNLAVLHQLPRLTELGFPTLIGTSRKSTIGKLTGKPVHARIAGTTATTALAVAAGIDIVRVHDVDEALDAVHVSDAIVRGWRPASWT